MEKKGRRKEMETELGRKTRIEERKNGGKERNGGHQGGEER